MEPKKQKLDWNKPLRSAQSEVTLLSKLPDGKAVVKNEAKGLTWLVDEFGYRGQKQLVWNGLWEPKPKKPRIAPTSSMREKFPVGTTIFVMRNFGDIILGTVLGYKRSALYWEPLDKRIEVRIRKGEPHAKIPNYAAFKTPDDVEKHVEKLNTTFRKAKRDFLYLEAQAGHRSEEMHA